MKHGQRKRRGLDRRRMASGAPRSRAATLVSLAVMVGAGVHALPLPISGAPGIAFASGSLAAPSGRAHLLTPIRRLGVRPVTTNIAALRAYLSKDTSGGAAPGGFAALPLSDEQASDRLLELLEHALETSGRYFHVSNAASQGGDAAGVLTGGAEAPAQALSAIERRLETDYDLDAWLQADAHFTPEQVRVRLTLRGPSGLLAREDVFARPDASEKDLHEAFLVALGRVAGTLGHDGRVTSMRDELVTLDFGKERGLSVGSRVELGLVVIAASHPASGETLRSRKVTTHVVEILDAREGTSIARVVRVHPLVVRKAAGLFSGGHADELPLLAWRQAAAPVLTTRGSDPWDAPRAVEVEPLTGAAAGGFGTKAPRGGHTPQGRAGTDPANDEARDVGFLGALFGNASDGSSPRSGGPSSDTADAGERQGARRGEPGRDDAEVEPHETRAEGTSEGTSEGAFEENPSEDAASSRSEAPRRKRSRDGVALLSARAGLGMTFGILETDRGDRYSDFPATVINTLRAQVHLALPSEWESKPELALRLYSGGDVEGTQYALAAPLMMPLTHSKDGRFLVGGELHVGGGSVKTIRVKESLSHLALLGVAEYEAHLAGFGEAEAGAGVSLFGLLGGHVEGFVKVAVSPASFLPKPLSLHARVESGPEHWTALEFGATWAFHQARGH